MIDKDISKLFFISTEKQILDKIGHKNNILINNL